MKKRGFILFVFICVLLVIISYENVSAVISRDFVSFSPEGEMIVDERYIVNDFDEEFYDEELLVERVRDWHDGEIDFYNDDFDLVYVSDDISRTEGVISGSYIIKFKSEPVSEKYPLIKQNIEKDLEGDMSINSLENLRKDYEAELKKEQKAIDDIMKNIDDRNFLQKLGILSAPEQKELKIVYEYFTTFNGISVKNISEEDFEKIKKSPYVESVSPDMVFEIFLMNSVPLIGADIVWAGY